MLTYVLRALTSGPYVVPVAAGAVIAAVVAAVGRGRSVLDRVAMALLAAWLVLALRAALIPAAWATGGVRGCDFSSWLPLTPERWLTPDPAALGIWLWLPAAVLSILADAARRPAALVVVIAAPAAVELARALLPALGHGCASTSLVTAYAGVLAGAVIGVVLAVLTSPLRRRPRAERPDADRLDDLLS